ncbi:MAG: gamma-glutamyltransferase, partial [Gammaproteobacteria bacterium]|nr:gamma-glutamyltransferase [Gammaproteobacteria bacterium]
VAGGNRAQGIRAARRAFYEGDIAAAIVEQQRQHGGFMTRADLAEFRAQVEEPVQARFGALTLHGCGPWSQGPLVLQAARILDGFELAGMGHNSTAYVHTVVEALKLAAADREAWFGDPARIEIPLAELLSDERVACQRARIESGRASPGMPAAAALGGRTPPAWRADPSAGPAPAAASNLETSYFCVVDSAGNVCSATPSDPTISGRVVPGTGITTSMWGSRGHTDADHPGRVEGGWRPRMSANPMLAIEPGRSVTPIGSPGSEVLGQAQLQVLLNLSVFGMSPQAAVEAPRFASYSWPASAIPHTYLPARLTLEQAIADDCGEALRALGHDVQRWPQRDWRAGSVCTIHCDLVSGIRCAGADPRRSAYAIGC